MRRTDRLFEIIQMLRSEQGAITANTIAERLEVSVRTVYRDIHALQAMRTPIEGEAGIGYVIRRGYDLPPINFSTEEVEAIIVGLNLLSRTGDIGLQKAAARVADKIDSLSEKADAFHVSSWGADAPKWVNPETLRCAIRDEKKLRLRYRDDEGRETRRTVLPIAMFYYTQAIVLVAWCELRRGFRHFRVDRIRACDLYGTSFVGRGAYLRERWTQEYPGPGGG